MLGVSGFAPRTFPLFASTAVQLKDAFLEHILGFETSANFVEEQKPGQTGELVKVT